MTERVLVALALQLLCVVELVHIERRTVYSTCVVKECLHGRAIHQYQHSQQFVPASVHRT